MRLTARQLNRATLARQALLERMPGSPVVALRRAVALQAQEPASPYVALWNRVEGFDASHLDTAFANAEIVKATLMRITLHAVTSDDYPAFHEAMVTNLRASRLNDRRFRESGATVDQVEAVLPRLVTFARETRTRPELEALIAEHLDGPPAEWVWWALRTFAPLAHAPTAAPWSFGQYPSYRAAPTTPKRPAPDQALQRLVRRYLEGFGPASLPDFAQFSMQRMPATRAAFDGLGSALVRHEGPDGVELFDVPDGVIPDDDTPAPPRLLGMWDSILLAYQDRSRVIPPDYRPLVIRRNGDVLPTVLVDGQAGGVWRPADQGIEVTAFESWDDSVWEGLAGEARSLVGFLAGRDPQVYRRYGRWWEDLPAREVRVM